MKVLVAVFLLAASVAAAPGNALSAAHLEAFNQILRTATDDEWIKQLHGVRAAIKGKK